MKRFITIWMALVMTIPVLRAQGDWPRSFRAGGETIRIYPWQHESFGDNLLKSSAAISVTEKEGDEPVFGMIWMEAETETRGGEVRVRTLNITDIRMPTEKDEASLSDLRQTIARALTQWDLRFPDTEIREALALVQEEQRQSASLSTQPPVILYSDQPALLVVIDGKPQLQRHPDWKLDVVINTPFTILRLGGTYYLFGGKHWYQAPSATGPYAHTSQVPETLSRLEQEIASAARSNPVQQEEKSYLISRIIVTTEPAELLQSEGEPSWTPVQGTSLLYVRNSSNDIFMDVASQQYYALLSGRWYRSDRLTGKWSYVDANRLPADFARIPPGSPKDNVLASVAGTEAARAAVLDARLPQTARVDRNNTEAEIEYDGDPQFERIDGTDLDYAVNTPDYVIRWRGRYYAVDNGVWFESRHPNGPWRVAVARPEVVVRIPPRYPVYAMKYVYIYDVTPAYVYMGYTPGYLNSFVFGPTVVYGTGYYYRPWFGRRYYARPFTWGFSMHYSPWIGWGFGFNYHFGWFHAGWEFYDPWGWGGWWGPRVYWPVYCHVPYYTGYHRGYYGTYGYAYRSPVIVQQVNNVNIYRTTNIYNYRNDVVAVDSRELRAARQSGLGRSMASDNLRMRENGANSDQLRDAGPGRRVDSQNAGLSEDLRSRVGSPQNGRNNALADDAPLRGASTPAERNLTPRSSGAGSSQSGRDVQIRPAVPTERNLTPRSPGPGTNSRVAPAPNSSAPSRGSREASVSPRVESRPAPTPRVNPSGGQRPQMRSAGPDRSRITDQGSGRR